MTKKTNVSMHQILQGGKTIQHNYLDLKESNSQDICFIRRLGLAKVCPSENVTNLKQQCDGTRPGGVLSQSESSWGFDDKSAVSSLQFYLKTWLCLGLSE